MQTANTSERHSGRRISPVKQDPTVFVSMSVPRAVAFMVVPSIISQIIHVVYNLADTWFVGLTGNPDAIAAVSLCLPLYNILTGLSNLFGVGGASVIARAVGYEDYEKEKRAFSIAFWAAGFFACLYSLFLFLTSGAVLRMIGADPGDLGFSTQYCMVTIVAGGVPTVLAATLSNLIRATGESRCAAKGMTIGALGNIVLDPLFMFVLLPRGNEVLGAALATTISNVISLLYFVIFFVRRRDERYCFRFVRFRKVAGLFKDICRSGLAGFTMVAMAMVSNCFLNSMIAQAGGSLAVAGLGIVRKIDSLAYAVNQGITQGMLPLVAYSYASQNQKRMRSIIGFSAMCTVLFSLCTSTLSFALAPQLVRIFIRNEETIVYGSRFLRILCLAIPVYSATFVIIAVFQAAGLSLSAFLLSILHKGSLDILLLYVFRALFGGTDILWAQPLTEVLALVTGIALLSHFLKQRDEVTIRKAIQ